MKNYFNQKTTHFFHICEQNSPKSVAKLPVFALIPPNSINLVFLLAGNVSLVFGQWIFVSVFFVTFVQNQNLPT
jgi:hypothetical protein